MREILLHLMVHTAFLLSREVTRRELYIIKNLGAKVGTGVYRALKSHEL